MRDEFPVSTVALGRGEMLNWSDAATDAGGGAQGGLALRSLMEATVPARSRVLLAGPYDVELVRDLLERGCVVDLVLRSYPDAQEMAHELAAYTALRITACSFESYEARDAYDVVVALDGVGRLYGPDGADGDWASTIERLTAMVHESARLLVTLDNDLGLDDVVAVSTPATARGDGDWGPPRDTDISRPAGARDLSSALRAHGWHSRVLGAFGHWLRPSLLVDAGALESASPAVSRLITQALTRDFAEQPVLSDPRALAQKALGHGLGLELAPAWVAVSSRHSLELASPVAIVGEKYPPPWGYSYVVDLSGHEPTVSLTVPPRLVAVGALQRDAATFTAGGVSGLTVEEALLDACERDDTVAIRNLLVRFRTWLQDTFVSEGAESLVSAVPDGVVVGDDGFQMLDASWTTLALPSVEVVLARALRRFAVRVLKSGSRHPWPAGQDAISLTMTMIAMSGAEPNLSDVIRAVHFEATVAAALHALDPASEADLVQRMLVDGTRVGEVGGYREALAALARARQDLESMREQMDWLDDTLQRKDRDLAEALQRVQDLYASRSWRVGRAVTKPARQVKEVLGKPAPE